MNEPEPQATLHDPDDTESGLSGGATGRPVRLLMFSGETISTHPLTNGTRLRGEKLVAGNRARLRVGDALEMGPLTIVVQRDKANVDARTTVHHSSELKRVDHSPAAAGPTRTRRRGR